MFLKNKLKSPLTKHVIWKMVSILLPMTSFGYDLGFSINTIAIKVSNRFYYPEFNFHLNSNNNDQLLKSFPYI